MASITFKNVSKTYDKKKFVVRNFNLEIADKEFVVLVGPSGCGKSTTIRMVAGLEEVSSGEIYIGNNFVNNVLPKDRNIAMVFQNYALYPHMSVRENIAFGLKLKKTPKSEIEKKINEAAKTLDIEQYLDRKPSDLSGGQRQRVALGRAMVRDAEVFLLDEPLSNLDAKLRNHMRTEILKLHNMLKKTFIYVTHDQTEAMTMGDKIVLMNQSRIVQVDSPKNIYEKPNSVFVASFIGIPQMNFFNAKILKNENRFALKIGKFMFNLPAEKTTSSLESHLDTEVIVGVRPENIQIKESGFCDDCFSFTALIDFIELTGSELNLHFEFEKSRFIAKVPSINCINRGDKIKFSFSSKHVHIFDKDTEMAIF